MGSKLNRIPHITYIIQRSIKIIIYVAIYIQQGLGWWQDNPIKSMLVINQTQTGLRLYCAIVPGCVGSYRQPRFEIVLIGILFKVLKWRPTNTHFSLAGWSWTCNTRPIYTKPWGIYVSSQTKIFWSLVLLPFLKPALVFGKDVYYHSNEGSLMRELQIWEEQQRTDNPPKEYGETRGGFSFC